MTHASDCKKMLFLNLKKKQKIFLKGIFSLIYIYIYTLYLPHFNYISKSNYVLLTRSVVRIKYCTFV